MVGNFYRGDPTSTPFRIQRSSYLLVEKGRLALPAPWGREIEGLVPLHLLHEQDHVVLMEDRIERHLRAVHANLVSRRIELSRFQGLAHRRTLFEHEVIDPTRHPSNSNFQFPISFSKPTCTIAVSVR